MNENNEHDKHPLDDLVARKLDNAVLPTSADGFARLQARMGQSQAEKRPGFVIWRNPNIQRAMAIAACLLLVCLFGWLYLSNGTTERMKEPQMAATKTRRSSTNGPATPQNDAVDLPSTERPDNADQLADNQPTEIRATKASINDAPSRANKKADQLDHNVNVSTPTPRIELAQNKSAEKTETTPVTSKAPVNRSTVLPTPTPDQLAVVKPASTERVLIVTIDEPERLVAARQVVKLEVMETALASANKPEKANKPGFWEQVRRVKEGEVFTRPDDGQAEERGLLNRAFNGLKNSIEKDKTARQ